MKPDELAWWTWDANRIPSAAPSQEAKSACAGAMKKGDVLTVAQLAGVMGAKRTAELIPLCHPLPLTHIDVVITPDADLPGVQIIATVRTVGKTGVEMEALTAVSVAALTVYDMAKAVEKTMQIQNIRLVQKHGGLSGDVVNG